MKRNSLIHITKFSENWPLNFGLQNMTYMAMYLVGHEYNLYLSQVVSFCSESIIT